MKLDTKNKWLGVATNNKAEYLALIEGLRAVEQWKPERLEIYLDSKLVVEQVNGNYRVKNAELQSLIAEAKALLSRFPNHEVKHVDREKNRRADYLANMAIDEHVDKKKLRR